MMKWMGRFIKKFRENWFLFQELVKRDFKKKYKRTILGMLWSVLNPLLHLFVMWLVFSQFFGRNTAHFVVYLFSGNIVYSFFSEATNQGMSSLLGNAPIFTKINVPKYMFLFSQNVTALINFLLSLAIYFVFVAADGIPFSLNFLALLYPITCLIVFNLGLGLILSALYVFFRDIQYIWSVCLQLLLYLSAIFYRVDSFPASVQKLFLLNPMYLYIKYFRDIVIDGVVPSPAFHALCAAYALVFFALGFRIYKKNNTKFLYYV
ncbi:MAG: ABC transporter permease [Clostridiaceae bacterium]